MIARHDDLRARQGVEIGARRFEFLALGALGEVARDHDDIGGEGFDQGAQGRQQFVVDLAEVQVR